MAMTPEQAEWNDKRVNWKEWVEVGCSVCQKYPSCKLGKMIVGWNAITDKDTDTECIMYETYSGDTPSTKESVRENTLKLKLKIEEDIKSGVLPLCRKKQ